MSKKRFAIPAADEVARIDDSDVPSAAKLYFKKGSSSQLPGDRGGSAGSSTVAADPSAVLSTVSSSSSTWPAANEPISADPRQSGSGGLAAAAASIVDAIDSATASRKAANASSPAVPSNERDSVSGSSSSSASGKPPPRAGAIVVNARQRGNPVLKHVRRVPWEFGETAADYELGRTTCALFLSLKYHSLHPEYVHERLKQLGRAYDLRVLLALCDVAEPSHALKELARVCVLADCTLIVAFTAEEAARYLEIYKTYEHKPPDLIMERPAEAADLYARTVDCLTTVKSVNKTDAGTLLVRFGTVGRIVNADEDDLCLCTGFGPQKAKRLSQTCREPFLVLQRKEQQQQERGGGDEAAGS